MIFRQNPPERAVRLLDQFGEQVQLAVLEVQRNEPGPNPPMLWLLVGADLYHRVASVVADVRQYRWVRRPPRYQLALASGAGWHVITVHECTTLHPAGWSLVKQLPGTTFGRVHQLSDDEEEVTAV